MSLQLNLIQGKIMKSTRIILIVLLSYLFVGSVYASEGKGLEIATEVDVRDRGFGDTTSTMTMTLFDQYGNSTSRKIRNRTQNISWQEKMITCRLKRPWCPHSVGSAPHC